MPRLRSWLDETLWGAETGQRLLLVHVGLAVAIGLRIGVGPYRHLGGMPDALVDPVPVLFWLPHMPSSAAIVAIQVVGTAAAAAAAARWHTRLTFAVAWISYLVLAGLRGSRGKVLHNDLLLLWAAAPFLLAPLEVAWHDRRPSRATGWPVRVATVFIVLAYFFAGFHKLWRSGFAWVLGDNMQHILVWGPSIGEPGWAAAATWLAARAWAAKLTALAIIGIELSFPVALVKRGLLPWFAVLAVVLHAGTYVALGLDYWAWMLVVPLLLVDWPALLPTRGSADAPVASGRV